MYNTLAVSPSFCLAEEKPTYGGALIWGTSNPPTIINPILSQHSVSVSLEEIIFNRLVRINAKGEIEPDLAREWKISEDGLVYTFYLRKGVKFHDGVECTADDIVFTYQQVINPRNNSPFRSHYELINNFEVIDKYTFQIILKEPFPAFLFKLVRAIIPKHIWQGQDLKESEFNYKPIGTGPFRFKSWDRETNQIELEANLDYFEGRPYLDRIIVKVYADNAKLWASLMRGEVDLVKFINPEDYLIVKDDHTFKAYQVIGGMYFAIVYNLEDPILSDIEVRRAIACAINKQEIIDLVFAGGGVESSGPFNPESKGFNPDVKPLEYNPVKARLKLIHSGWQDINGDGIFEKNVRQLSITLLVDNKNNTYKKIAAIIRQQLSMVGIKLNVQLYDDESQLTADYLKEHNAQAWLRFLAGPKFDEYESAEDWYSLSTEFAKIWVYKNEKVDELFELLRTAKDENQCIEIYRQIHKIVYEDQPASFLFFPASFHAVSAKFKNTDKHFTAYMPTYTIKDWYVLDR